MVNDDWKFDSDVIEYSRLVIKFGERIVKRIFRIMNRLFRDICILFCVVFVIYGVASFIKADKIVPLEEHNIKNLDFQQVINSVKNAYNVMNETKIDDFKVTYKPDGSIKRMQMKLVEQKENRFYTYNAHYDIEIGGYDKGLKIQHNKVEEWPQYSRIFDESKFVGYMKQLDYDSLKPKDVVQDYDSYSIMCTNNDSIYSVNSNFDVYKIKDEEIKKLTDEKEDVKGFALWFQGNKIITYPDHVSEQSKSSSVYVFTQ